MYMQSASNLYISSMQQSKGWWYSLTGIAKVTADQVTG